MLGVGVSLFAAQAATSSTVAIEPPASLPEQAGAQVVESCSRALGEGRCVLWGPTTRTPLVARLRWDGEVLLVELHAEESEVPRAQSSLKFSEADDETQRWVAAGLLVAALTVAETLPDASRENDASSTATPTASPPPQPVVVVAPAPAGAEEADDGAVASEVQASTVLGRLDLGVVAGQGMNGGEARLGGTLRGWVTSTDARVAFTASGRFASATSLNGAARAEWLGGSVGLGICLTECASHAWLAVVGEGVIEHTEVEVERNERTERAGAWRGGGRLGLVGALRLTRLFGFWVGADATLLEPEVVVRVQSQPVDRESPLRWAAAGGIRAYVDPAGGTK